MYFLAEEEKRYLLRKLLPEARAQQVVDELRGWSWHQPPISPIYHAPLGVYEVAGRYCPTSRDTYLRRVVRLRRPPNPDMVEGAALHELLVRLVLDVKRTIYEDAPGCVEQLRGLTLPALAPDHPALELGDEFCGRLEQRRRALWRFELTRVLARVEDALARQPYAGADSLVALALPIVVESRLDGRFLGLSQHLAADAVFFSQPMVLDVKFGEPRTFHRLGTTGYALVLESLHEYPVDVGCVVYLRFDGERILLDRDFHIIGDELRQQFLEERDRVARLAEEEIDPGVADECPLNCPFFEDCHPGSQQGRRLYAVPKAGGGSR